MSADHLNSSFGKSEDMALFDRILSLFRTLRKDKKEKFNRILPFGDYFVDRWEKAANLGFGAGTSVYDSCLILGDVFIGENTWVGPFTILDGSGHGLTIGSHCSISAGVHIYTHDTVQKTLGEGEVQLAPVKIGDHCYIGPNVIISKGVTIGDHSVIGANSFVNRDIPANSKAFGTPVKVVGKSR